MSLPPAPAAAALPPHTTPKLPPSTGSVDGASETPFRLSTARRAILSVLTPSAAAAVESSDEEDKKELVADNAVGGFTDGGDGGVGGVIWTLSIVSGVEDGSLGVEVLTISASSSSCSPSVIAERVSLSQERFSSPRSSLNYMNI